MTHAQQAWPPLPRAEEFCLVDLRDHYNNDGTTHPGSAPSGDLDGEGMAFPHEHLPPSDQVTALGGVPFLFPDRDSGAANNVCLAGQRVAVASGAYSRLHVLGASEGGSFEEPLTLRYADGVSQELTLGLTDCRPHWGQARFGEERALVFDEMWFPPGDTHICKAPGVCGLWVQSLDVDPARRLVAIGLGDNRCMHVFAMTLRKAPPDPEPSR